MQNENPPVLPAALARVCALGAVAIQQLETWIRPLFDLAIRLYVAQIFFRSGLVKISDWENTRFLFHNEYHVPILPPDLAAVMGAGGELLFPVLLVLGLGGRFSAAGLFVVNAMAVISYPDLSDLGLRDHILWGVLMLVIVFHGPGRLSLDHCLSRRLGFAARTCTGATALAH